MSTSEGSFLSSLSLSMRRSSSSFHLFAAAAPSTPSMSLRPTYRGRGQSQSRGGVSGQPNGGGHRLFTGESYGNGNLGLRQGEDDRFARPSVHRVPAYNQNQPFYRQPQLHQNPPMRYPRPYNPNPGFRRFQPSRPRPSDYRNWEYSRHRTPSQCERFIILSYNILADYLAINHRDRLYNHIPPKFLDWRWRKRSIIFELSLWSADIMCFQEVDRFQDLEEELKRQGYHGIWKMRTGNAIDGCAIFWRGLRFKLLHEEGIEFNKLGLRDNVAQICVLELMCQNSSEKTSALPTSSTSSNKVVICNIHVLYNPKRGEIKLGQVREFLNRAHSVSKAWNGAPVVLCGDFNSTPESPLYNFISEQKLNLMELDRDKVSGQASAEINTFRTRAPNPKIRSADRSSEVKKDSLSHTAGASADQTDPDACIPVDKKENQSKSHDYGGFLVDIMGNRNNDETEPQMAPRCKIICNDVVETGDEEKADVSFSVDGSSVNSYMGDDFLTKARADLGPMDTSISDASSSELFHQSLFPSAIEPSHSVNDNKGNESTSCQISFGSTNIDVASNEKTENLHYLDEDRKGGGNAGEDCDTFLSKLHGTEDCSSLGFDQTFNAVPHNLKSDIPSNEVVYNFSHSMDSVPADAERTTYDPSRWTEVDIATATGNADCTVMEHALKLQSTYAETEDRSGTRDSNGEPLVTSYNRCFLGTVDYIWRSEGLQTLRVLAPMRKDAMQWTLGYPTKKWGSDHVALASELAFVEDSMHDKSETRCQDGKA